MGENFWKLNQGKSEIVVVGFNAEKETVQFYLSTHKLKVWSKVTNLGGI